MDTALTTDFADGAYRFWLPMPRVIAAEREMGGARSIFALFYDLGEALAQAGNGRMVLAGVTEARLSECHAVIRNALVGGNEGRVAGETVAVGDGMARELVETYCYPARPAMHDLALAWEVLRAAIYGIDTAASGSKKKPVETGDHVPS